MRLAIIDLGTNSVRFDVHEVGPEMKHRLIHREKRMVRLGDGVFTQGKLDAEASARTLAAFAEFQAMIRHWKVERVVAFATSALRDAEDSADLIRTIKRKTSIALSVIEGAEEARLIAKGILNNEVTPDGLFTLIDIGGGSTEVSLCHKKKLIDCHSFDLGANRLQQVFLKENPPKSTSRMPDPVASLRRHVRRTVQGALSGQSWPQAETVIGSSGTIRAFKRILKRMGKKVEPFRKQDLEELLRRLGPMKPAQLLDVPGMEPKRVDMILAGGILLDEVLSVIGGRRVFTTECSLRDGVLELELGRLALPPGATAVRGWN